MISYEGGIHAVPMTPESFGRREGNPKRATLYEEAPWLYKRKGAYYLFMQGGLFRNIWRMQLLTVRKGHGNTEEL